MGETGVTNPDITSYLGTVTAVKGRESLTRLLWRSGGWGGGWGEEGGGGGGRGGPKLVPEGVAAGKPPWVAGVGGDFAIETSGLSAGGLGGPVCREEGDPGLSEDEGG